MEKEINWKSLDVKNLPESEVEILCSVDKAFLETSRKQALKNIQEKIDLPGFRKGQVPEKIIIQKFGEIFILEEAAEIIISEIYPKIIKDKKINPLGRPEVKITKIAQDNDLEFSLKTAIVPEVTLPDYKNISKKINQKPIEKNEVNDKELEEAILGIRSFYSPKGPDGKSLPLPDLTDEFVKKIGQFENVKDFREKIKKGVTEEKENKSKEKVRMEIIEKIIDETKCKLPNILIENELNRMLSEFEHDIQKSGITLKEYLDHIKKTEEDLKKEWNDSAKKRALTQLVLNEISRKENILADEEKVHHLAHQIIDSHKGADHEAAHIYAETILTNAKVFEFLSNQK